MVTWDLSPIDQNGHSVPVPNGPKKRGEEL